MKQYHRDRLHYLNKETAKEWSKQALMDDAQRQIALDDAIRARVAALTERELSSLGWKLPNHFDAIIGGPLRHHRQQIEDALQSVESKRAPT